MPRGALIAFEGLDRAGKSSQCAALAERLRAQGRRVRVLRFPGMFFLSTFGFLLFLLIVVYLLVYLLA